jgi:thioredoxin reductase (NADPH)
MLRLVRQRCRAHNPDGGDVPAVYREASWWPAVFLANYARHVRVLVRGRGLSSTMSQHLIDRTPSLPNIAVLCDTEVVELLGTPDQGLQGVRWRNRRTGAEEQHAIGHVVLFTGLS